MGENADSQAASVHSAGDVVWARITRIGWWPAVVVKNEDIPESFGKIRENAVAVVKFFNEDEYEEIMQRDKIQAYKCDDKLDYIQQGMVRYLDYQKKRAKNSPFDNFPSSVVEAEKLTGGDTSLGEPEKYNVKKTPAVNKYKDIFVDPEEKMKSPAKGTGKVGKAKMTPQKATPRFRGNPDHEVRIRQQPSPLMSEDVSGSPISSPGQYRCEQCKFTSSRLNVLILHRKSHREESQPATPVKAKPKKRERSSNGRTSRKKKPKNEEETSSDLFDAVKSNTTDSNSKKKTKTPAKKTPKKEAKETPSKSPKKKWLTQAQSVDPEVKNKILADWDDDDMEVEETREKAESESENEVQSRSNVVENRSDEEESEAENGKPENRETNREEVAETKETEEEKESRDRKLKEELEALLAETAPPLLPSNLEKPSVATSSDGKIEELPEEPEAEKVDVKLENHENNEVSSSENVIDQDDLNREETCEIVQLEGNVNAELENHENNEVFLSENVTDSGEVGGLEETVQTDDLNAEETCEIVQSEEVGNSNIENHENNQVSLSENITDPSNVAVAEETAQTDVLNKDETYVLVSYHDETDGLQGLENLDSALLAYETTTGETESTDLGNLFLAVDEGNMIFDSNQTPKDS